ncbi:ankyrin repeat family protein [Tanacetum coccineum]
MYAYYLHASFPLLEHVPVFVAYNGKWEWEGKELLFMESKGSIMVVSKYVTLSQITDILCTKFDVDRDSRGLKLEVYYRIGFPIIEIECDEDLSLFISESSKTKLLLCVTVVLKADVAEGVGQDEINPDIKEESPHGLKENEINPDIKEESSPHGLKENEINPDIKEESSPHGLKENEINPDIKEESPHGLKENEINPDIKEESSPHGRKDDTAKNRLIKAIRKNDWVKAREIVNTKEVTWTSKLDDEGNTALHFAVGLYKDNEVVRDILMRINCELLITTVDNNGANAAHIAALFGNTEALKIMLDSNPKCLFILDNFGLLAIHYPLTVSMIKTFLYLFKQMKSYKVEFDIFLRGQNGLTLLCQAIDKGLIDVAYELINDYPSMAAHIPLEVIIKKPELFYSGTHYNLCLLDYGSRRTRIRYEYM